MVNYHVSLKQHGQQLTLNHNHLILSQLLQLTATLLLSITVHKVFNFLVIIPGNLVSNAK